MKTSLQKTLIQSSLLLAIGVLTPRTALPTEIPRSVFVLPINPKEGCDPFFPKSSRPYESAIAASGRQPELTSLVIKGFSGSVNRRFVIINNHTFAAGDSAEVLTSEGRIFIHCLEINGNKVVVEARGQRHELIFSGD